MKVHGLLGLLALAQRLALDVLAPTPLSLSRMPPTEEPSVPTAMASLSPIIALITLVWLVALPLAETLLVSSLNANFCLDKASAIKLDLVIVPLL